MWFNHSLEPTPVSRCSSAFDITGLAWLSSRGWPHSHHKQKRTYVRREIQSQQADCNGGICPWELGIGGKIADSVRQIAENGRYIQYDFQKDALTTGNTTQHFPSTIIDTRTGNVSPPVVYNR